MAIRLKAIKNIQKITKTMKMISAAKFAQASKAILPARSYGEGALGKSLKLVECCVILQLKEIKQLELRTLPNYIH